MVALSRTDKKTQYFFLCVPIFPNHTRCRQAIIVVLRFRFIVGKIFHASFGLSRHSLILNELIFIFSEFFFQGPQGPQGGRGSAGQTGSKVQWNKMLNSF